METSHAIEAIDFDLKLSPWDQRFPPMYSKRILFFPHADTTSEDHSDIVYTLKSALQLMAEDLPFLTGTVGPVEGKPWIFDIQPGGTIVLSVKDLSAELDYEELRKADFPSALLDPVQFFQYYKPMYVGESGLPVCSVQLSLLGRGGMALVVQVAHTVCDGRGITAIMALLAEKFRFVQQGRTEVPSQNASKPVGTRFAEDRRLLLKATNTHDGFANHPAWTTEPMRPAKQSAQYPIRPQSFFISQRKLRDLKAFAQSTDISSDSVKYISTHDAICALIWQSLIQARQKVGILEDDTDSCFTTAVDCRSRLKLPRPYYGNAIDAIKVSLSSRDLVARNGTDPGRSRVRLAARTIRRAISAISEESFRSLVGLVERNNETKPTRLAVLGDLTTKAVMVISWFGFEMYDLDFGELLNRTPEACRVSHHGMIPGMAYVLPKIPGPAGGCEFVLNEPTEVLQFLEQDEIFSGFVQRV